MAVGTVATGSGNCLDREKKGTDVPTALRKLALVAVALLSLSTMAASRAGTAYAAADAGDPYTSGCDNTAVTGRLLAVVYDGTRIGNAELRYSTSCQTEWVTFYSSSGYAANNFYIEPSVWLQNQTGTNLYTAASSPSMGTVYTDMLPDMRYRTACGGIQLYRGLNAAGEEQEDWLGWYYIGCY